LQILRIDDVTDRGLFRSQHRRGSRDLDGLGQFSNLQPEIDFQHCSDFEDDARANLFLESGCFHLDGVCSRV
jgi:hypothetical protein